MIQWKKRVSKASRPTVCTTCNTYSQCPHTYLAATRPKEKMVNGFRFLVETTYNPISFCHIVISGNDICQIRQSKILILSVWKSYWEEQISARTYRLNSLRIYPTYYLSTWEHQSWDLLPATVVRTFLNQWYDWCWCSFNHFLKEICHCLMNGKKIRELEF